MGRQYLENGHFRSAAVALAIALLFGCGGGGDSSSSLPEQPAAAQPQEAAPAQPAAVQLRETATVLSVRTELPSSGDTARFEAQALNYSFAAHVDTGPDAGYALTGRLELKGEREDDGLTEVEGHLYPDADASMATRAESRARFDADRKALRDALREDITVLAAELKLALADGAASRSDASGAARREALQAFKAKFNRRIEAYRAALSARIAEYRGANRDAGTGGDDDSAAKGYEVHGTIDANGVVNLIASLGDKGKLRASGMIAADGRAQGSLTGPASGDQGTWTAVATGVVDPPSPPPSAGAYQAGLAKYMATCSFCHSAGKVDTSGTAGDLAGEPEDLASNLGRVDRAMNGMTLTAQEILDLKAFLRAANSPPALPPPAPPPADCAGQAVTWTQAALSCSATYAGGKSGSTSALSDLVAPATGTANAVCSNGVLTLSAQVCTTGTPPPPPPPAPPPPSAAYAAGLAKYQAACAACHAAGSLDPTGPFANLAGRGGLLVNDLGSISGMMAGMMLTNQEILDLQAFLSAVP